MTDSRSGVMDRSDTPTSTSPWPTASSRPMRSYSWAFQVSPGHGPHHATNRYSAPGTARWPLVTKGGATTTPTRRKLAAVQPEESRPGPRDRPPWRSLPTTTSIALSVSRYAVASWPPSREPGLADREGRKYRPGPGRLHDRAPFPATICHGVVNKGTRLSARPRQEPPGPRDPSGLALPRPGRYEADLDLRGTPL
jgi:hypothetical protein